MAYPCRRRMPFHEEPRLAYPGTCAAHPRRRRIVPRVYFGRSAPGGSRRRWHNRRGPGHSRCSSPPARNAVPAGHAELEHGNWAFVSFPAFLLGRSLLESLSTTGQTLFEAGYWNQMGSPAPSLVEEQRRLLARVESRRIHFHPTGNATPIRVVYVAWGVIRLGGDFLLVHREDEHRRDAKNYVFPGGRLNVMDLPPEQRNPTSLRALHESDLALAALGLENTLKRENQLLLSLVFLAPLLPPLWGPQQAPEPHLTSQVQRHKLVCSVRLSPCGPLGVPG